MRSVLVTAVSPTSSVTEPDVEGAGGPKQGGCMSVKYSCEHICENQCWVSSSGKVEMGDIFWTFIHLEGFSPGRRESTSYFGEWEMSDITYCHIGFLLCSLNCQAHSSLWAFPLAIPTLWNSVLTALEQLSHLGFCIQPKEHLRKVCIGCPVWDDISQMPLYLHEAMRLVLPHVLRANVIAGSLGLKLYENFFTLLY